MKVKMTSAKTVNGKALPVSAARKSSRPTSPPRTAWFTSSIP